MHAVHCRYCAMTTLPIMQWDVFHLAQVWREKHRATPLNWSQFSCEMRRSSRRVMMRSWTPEINMTSHSQTCRTSEDAFDFLFKIILIGDSNVGKTCVVQSFKTGLYSERQQNTIGVDFTVRTLNINGKRVKVFIFFLFWFHPWMWLMLIKLLNEIKLVEKHEVIPSQRQTERV